MRPANFKSGSHFLAGAKAQPKIAANSKRLSARNSNQKGRGQPKVFLIQNMQRQKSTKTLQYRYRYGYPYLSCVFDTFHSVLGSQFWSSKLKKILLPWSKLCFFFHAPFTHYFTTLDIWPAKPGRGCSVLPHSTAGSGNPIYV